MTNVKLSTEELRIVTDAALILTKNRIIQKVYDLFGETSETFKTSAAGLPTEVLAIAPKISKGENYKGLPWVMLDYPRNFSQQDVLAVRCFFWWGNFFSITLQLQGKYQHSYAAAAVAGLNAGNGWWICRDFEDAWQHHFEDDYYVPNSGAETGERSFIKLAKKIPLGQWDDAPRFLRDAFEDICRVLSAEAVK